MNVVLNRGFTLIELIVVMVLIGIVGLSASAQITAMLGYEQTTSVDELYARLRLVQRINMNRDDSSCVVVTMNQSAIWHQESNSCSTVNLNSERKSEITFDASVAINGSTNNMVNIVFDTLGRPVFCNIRKNTNSITISKVTPTTCSFTIGEEKTPFSVNEEGYINYGNES